jgi:hypothetical protein
MTTTSLLEGDPEYLKLRAEIERLKAEKISLLNWLNTYHPHVAIAWAKSMRRGEHQWLSGQ